VYPQVDSTTNRARMIGDYGFDANGNWMGSGGSQINAWNVENQLISNGSVDGSGNLLTYTYDPWGKRVLQYSVSTTYGPSGTLFFYSITGQRLATYQVNYVGANYPPIQGSVNRYFGGRVLAAVDRLGSVRQNQTGLIAYYPWGEERTSTPDGTDKFGTYFRDSSVAGVGEDYASARYYNNNFGRFWSSDPGGNAHANDPQGWNRYSYAGSDPVNHSDPTGMDTIKTPSQCVVYSADGSTCLVSIPTPFPSPFCWSGEEDDRAFTCFGDGAGGTGGMLPTQTAASSFILADCNQLTSAAGIPGLTYANAMAIWHAGALGLTNNAATIAAMAAVTWQGESSFSTNPTNNGNYNSQGVLTSVDFGPFQINQFYNPNPNWAVWGTTGAGQTFDGNPTANIRYGIQILENLYNQYGNNAPDAYVGLGSANGQAREQTWNNEKAQLIQLFSNASCFQHL
jgi:RHS repeat-associated protein